MLIFTETRGLCLDETLQCGQCFRWKKQDGVWQGVVAGRAVRAAMSNGALYLDGANEADRAFWQNYFVLDLDYPALLARFSAGNKHLCQCVQAAPGIRVLRQPFFETLITFIISQNNNIPRIMGIVERLCQLCGQKLAPGIYAFPTPQALAAQTEESLACLRAGWRTGYLLATAQRIADGEVCEEKLRAMKTTDARAALMTLRGVGPKVADCTLLFGLGRWEAFPMDVWMKRAMSSLFPRGIPVCCRKQAGIAQQYIFAYARNNL